MPAVGAPRESIRVGDIRVTWVPDGIGLFSPTAFLEPSTDAEWRERHPDAIIADGRMLVSLGGMLVQTPSHTVLIDQGKGPERREIEIGFAEGGELMNSLTAEGVAPEQVDAVVYTHLHLDHIGWTSVAGLDGYRLQFPNARHLMHRDEWKFWEGKDEDIGLPLESHEKPLRERVELVGGDTQIVPGLTLVHTPGHTPGHSCVVVESQGQRVYVIGDVMHSPAQVSETWVCFAEVDFEQSRDSREMLLRELQRSDTIGAGTHFPNSVFGRVVAVDSKPHWVMR
jgi:glyoxylase-like metal-dependent hydrolase (beta-lactamase superfamily II)